VGIVFPSLGFTETAKSPVRLPCRHRKILCYLSAPQFSSREFAMQGHGSALHPLSHAEVAGGDPGRKGKPAVAAGAGWLATMQELGKP